MIDSASAAVTFFVLLAVYCVLFVVLFVCLLVGLLSLLLSSCLFVCWFIGSDAAASVLTLVVECHYWCLLLTKTLMTKTSLLFL